MTHTDTHLVDLGIPHKFLHGVVAVETVAAEDLDGVARHLVGDVPGVGLGDGGIVRVPITHVHLPGRALVGHAGQLHLQGHLGQEEGHRLVLGGTTGWRKRRADEGSIQVF